MFLERFENEGHVFDFLGRYGSIASVGLEEEKRDPPHSMMLRFKGDEAVASFSQDYDVSKYPRVHMVFFFQSVNVRQGDFFVIEMSVDGGPFTVIKTFNFFEDDWHDWNENYKWVRGGAGYILEPGDTFINFRFRADFNGIRRKVFFDRVVLAGWTGPWPLEDGQKHSDFT